MIITDLAAVTGAPHRRDRIVFTALTVLATALQAAVALMLVPLLEALFGDRPADAWPWVAAMLAGLAVAWTADVAATHAGVRIGLGLVRAGERDGVAAIRRLDPGDLHSDRASRLRDLVSTSAPEAVSSVVLLLSPLMHAVLLVPMLAVGLLLIAWQLAAVALIGGVLLFAAFLAGRAAVARSEAAFADAGRAIDDAMFEFGWAQPTLRAAGAAGADGGAAGVGSVESAVAASRRHGFRLLAWQVPGDLVFSVVGQLVLLGFGVTAGALYLSGDLSGVTAAAMIVVLLRVVETTGSLALLATPFTAMERLLADLRGLAGDDDPNPATPNPVTPTAATPDPTGGRPRPVAAALRSVGYAYPDGTRALDGVDLDIEAGRITVVVGASGSGKSTLLDVLAGLREPTAGSVVFDGAPAPAARRLADSSVVFQTTSLRSGTLAENVLTSADADLTEIADSAGLGPVLAALPDGWDTRVGEGANTLSGGERQRVGLARALAKPAGLLLIDEATSALDVVTERAVVDSLRRIRGDRTVVIVTHRPALVSLADSVVVLDGGRVADCGSVDDLRARGGVFADLWRRWRESEGWRV
ncbi:ABC transporter ATP-binding protein [Gordonia shandongensis]|uniref:ABC transporter ATP-binding protein n=1 Tax=Gordonia shandongensis TaxID=376351 RepID=UPI000406E0D3|nr:ABC transporter ATP-binding protein [Gordonia shandongensis]